MRLHGLQILTRTLPLPVLQSEKLARLFPSERNSLLVLRPWVRVCESLHHSMPCFGLQIYPFVSSWQNTEVIACCAGAR